MTAMDELRARDEAWRQCAEARDAKAMLEYLCDDYALVIVQPKRAIVPRDQWLRTLGEYQIHEWRTEDQIIDVDGDTGVILQRVSMRATVFGEDRSGTFIISDVWRRRNGRWLVWRRHSTPLSAGAHHSTR